jgi:hypothetical protein
MYSDAGGVMESEPWGLAIALRAAMSFEATGAALLHILRLLFLFSRKDT